MTQLDVALPARGARRWVLAVLPVVGVVALVFLPVYLVSNFESGDAPGQTGSDEATVGIAVILRATARRLLRTASSSVLRTTVGTLSRTAARTFTRQFIKFILRILGAGVVMSVVDQETGGRARPTARRSAISLGVGLVALAASFWGVLMVASESTRGALTTHVDLLTISLLAAAPLAVYAAINWVVGRMVGVRVAFETAIDGLLLQGYFTGSGSFLPMTTDVVFEGTPTNRATLAIASISGLFLVHLVLAALGGDGTAVHTASSFFLIYCFVYAFPIKPLEGYEIWNRSKLLWLGVWVPILYSFVEYLPGEFGAIL